MNGNATQISQTSLEKKRILLINHILANRKKAINIIKSKIRQFIGKKQVVKYYLLKNIIERRKELIIKIQKCLRIMLRRRNLKYIRENEQRFNYRIFYPKKATSVQIKIYNFNSQPFIIYDLNYCEITQCYHSYIGKEKLPKEKYFFQFIVDGYNTINPEFPSGVDSEGNYFNILNVVREKTFTPHKDKITINTNCEEKGKNKHSTGKNNSKRKSLSSPSYSNYKESEEFKPNKKHIYFKNRFSYDNIEVECENHTRIFAENESKEIYRKSLTNIMTTPNKNTFKHNSTKEKSKVSSIYEIHKAIASPKPILKKPNSKTGIKKRVSFSNIIEISEYCLN